MINKEVFTSYFNHCYIPHWKCSKCKNGFLKFDQKDGVDYLIQSTMAENHNPKSQREGEEHRFAVILVCTSCSEPVSVLGVRKMEEYSFHNNAGDEISGIEPRWYPQVFYPALDLFEIPKAVPVEAKRHIRQAFFHFINDPSASVNHIRTALELILDDQKVARISAKGKRRLPLAHRIDRWLLKNKKHAALSAYVTALRHIGNDGSHSDLVTEDVFDALDFLSHLLEDIYNNRSAILQHKLKMINSKKRARSKIRMKPEF